MKRGFLPPMILLVIVFVFLMLLPIIFSEFFPAFKWLMMAYFCIMIYLFVKRILGSGIVTLVVSGILIYIFVYQLLYIFAAAYILYLIVGLGLSGIIVFGLPSGGLGRKARAVK
jgi:hypothetical protein